MGGQDKREQAIQRVKKRREQAIQRVKMRREQAIQRVKMRRRQQRTTTQQPARQPTPQPRTQPTPTQPRVVIPEFTDRANKLGDLIALYLRGDWDYNTGMQVARQYAPAGTTEAELRAAVVRAAQAQGKQGNLAIRALVQPEVVDPRVNISDLPKQSTLQNVARGLQAPLRSVSAGATMLAGKRNPQGMYGKESGGKPFPAPQSFAESYASDPTFGSALELALPDMPRWMRVLIGGALDFALDPINLTGVGAVKKVVSTPARAISRTATVQKVAQPVKRVVGAVGTRIMHPTAAKQMAGLARTVEMSKQRTQQAIADVGRALEQYPVFYSLPRMVGSQMQRLRDEVEKIVQTANNYDPLFGKINHDVLNFPQLWERMKMSNISYRVEEHNPLKVLQERIEEDLGYLRQLRNNVRFVDVDGELGKRVENVINELEKSRDAWIAHAGYLETALNQLEQQPFEPLVKEVLWSAGHAVFQREVKPQSSIINRAIDAWKRTKTVYNPATHTRNLLQNFLFRYLTGDIDFVDVFRLPITVRDMMRLRQLAESGEPIPFDLAYQFLLTRQQSPHLPFSQREYFENIPTPPNMREAMSSARQSARPSDTIRAGVLPSETGIPISNLPRNWRDVFTLPFQRLREIVQNARSKQQPLVRTLLDAIHSTAVRAYNAGDMIPALLMEATRRRKQYAQSVAEQMQRGRNVAQATQLPEEIMRSWQETQGRKQILPSPFRMDYSTVPETIGTLNIALLPFFNYQYFALRGLRDAIRRNPERIYNILVKPVERSTRSTQADDEQGVSQSPRFGFAEREMIPISITRGLPFSSLYPMDPHFAEPLLSPTVWLSRSPLTAIARPIVQNRDDLLGMLGGVAREFTPPSAIHAWYALMGEPQRGLQPTLPHTRLERILRAVGFNIQPVNAMQIAQQQQRTQQQQQREQLRFDPANINDVVKQILRRFGM